ncbi:hypothetical protein Q2Y29_003032 [Vibrio alginolyticus]|nr:hypothetical protein [Vibrio alginolyticus]
MANIPRVYPNNTGISRRAKEVEVSLNTNTKTKGLLQSLTIDAGRRKATHSNLLNKTHIFVHLRFSLLDKLYVITANQQHSISLSM